MIHVDEFGPFGHLDLRQLSNRSSADDNKTTVRPRWRSRKSWRRDSITTSSSCNRYHGILGWLCSSSGRERKKWTPPVQMFTDSGRSSAHSAAASVLTGLEDRAVGWWTGSIPVSHTPKTASQQQWQQFRHVHPPCRLEMVVGIIGPALLRAPCECQSGVGVAGWPLLWFGSQLLWFGWVSGWLVETLYRSVSMVLQLVGPSSSCYPVVLVAGCNQGESHDWGPLYVQSCS